MESTEKFAKITIDSYNGTEPFLFVSYSHRDSGEVSKILEYIDKEKFRMWYDDTMEIGEDFREELRSKIEASCGILLFISESSLNSKYCGMEIITAFKYNKRIYPFYLEDNVKIPPALQMILENLQHISTTTATSHRRYLQKLVSSLPIEAMKALHMEGDVLVKCKDGSPVIQIPKDVAAIGNAAFKNCEKLETLVVGDNLKSLGSEAFRGCKRLSSLDLPETVKKIEAGHSVIAGQIIGFHAHPVIIQGLHGMTSDTVVFSCEIGAVPVDGVFTVNEVRTLENIARGNIQR